MDLHASWHHEDILGLIPGLNDAVVDKAKPDPAVVPDAVKRSVEQHIVQMQSVIESDDYKRIQTTTDVDALFRVLDKMEAVLGKSSGIAMFLCLAPIHYAGQEKELAPAFEKANEHLQQYMLFMDQNLGSIIQNIASLSEEQLQAGLAHVPERQRFAPMIELCRKMKEHKPATEDDFRQFNAALEQLKKVADFSLDDDARKNAYAEGMTGVVRFKLKQAKSLGYKDTLDQFAHTNKAPVNLIHDLSEAAHAQANKLSCELKDIALLARERAFGSPDMHTYSWDETKDIVCAAYARLDPQLGVLARRAFDEGWIHASSDDVPNPLTVAGIPASLSAKGHPFGAVTFTGNAEDVMITGHEMAHVLSNHLSGQKHGILTNQPSLMVQECFSHFGEALMEHEMMARAEGPVNKALVHAIFAAKEADVVAIALTVKFEEELYRLVQSKGAQMPSYEEIDALYKQCHEPVKALVGEHLDVRDWGGIWSSLNQPVHTMAVYPVTKIMAAALYEEFERNPEQFRKQYLEVMEAGGTIGVNDVWDSLLGKDTVDRKSFLTERMEKLFDRAAAVKTELQALPVPEKIEELEPKEKAGSRKKIKPTALIDRAAKSDGAEIAR